MKKKTWVFKCDWDATSVTIKVEATNEKQAEYKAWGYVSRKEGGDGCQRITLKDVR